MLKGGFPPIYPIDPDSIMETKDHIKRNFSSNNIIDINSILMKKKSTNIISMLNLSEQVESDDNDNNNKKKKNRNFKNEKIDDKNFINYISDLTNIKEISRIKKSSKKKLK
jgi:hypothetical protein